ncbi:MAG TPA: prepilin-type N-terminal cleavage/methylation domain-containing protein [Terriglobia bacterium]|nr:prepilin-type N-terminal cleavage/methylation domain-containing protein [Terriglobia bacterium]
MRSRAEGYTLLELVIGMTLMAMLMTALVIGIGVGSRAWQHGELRLRQTRRGQERTSFVAQQIASLVPYRVQSTDPVLPGVWPILEASQFRFRFVSSQGSRFRARSGLVLVEYVVVPWTPGTVALALHETPVVDDSLILRHVIERMGQDPDTGNPTVIYAPPVISATDPRVMTGLRAVWFEYQDPHPKSGDPAWLSDWRGTPESPFPTAVLLRWRRVTGEVGEEVFPLRAQVLPQGLVTQ